MDFSLLKPCFFNFMEQRGYDFVKHCNKTAYAGLLITVDDNLSKANEMGKTDIIVFMNGSDTFGLTGEFVLFDPHLEGIMAHIGCKGSWTPGCISYGRNGLLSDTRRQKKSALNNRHKPLELNSDLLSLFSTVLVLY